MNDKIGGKGQLDIGVVITAPTKDKEWFKKCLVMGLLMIVPIAGMLNLMGWTRAVAERRMANGEDKDVLPEAGLNYIGMGWRMFLSNLPIAGLFFLVMIVGFGGGGAAMALGERGGHAHGAGEMVGIIIMVVMYCLMIILALGLSVIGPAISFLHIVEDEPWASAQFKRIWETMKAGGAQYLLFFVAVLIAGMIAQLGVLACYVGMFVSIPFAQAMTGAAIAEYAKLIKPMEPSFPLEGGTGADSGTPFGVKL